MEKYYCGNGCPFGGSDDCFWWKGHECKNEDLKVEKMPNNEEELLKVLYCAYMAGAYTEKSGTFKDWYECVFKNS